VVFFLRGVSRCSYWLSQRRIYRSHLLRAGNESDSHMTGSRMIWSTALNTSSYRRLNRIQKEVILLFFRIWVKICSLNKLVDTNNGLLGESPVFLDLLPLALQTTFTTTWITNRLISIILIVQTFFSWVNLTPFNV